MAKQCEVCKRTYPDTEPACPYCAEAVEIIPGAAPPAPPPPKRNTKRRSSVVDLGGDLPPTESASGTSDVQLAQTPAQMEDMSGIEIVEAGAPPAEGHGSDVLPVGEPPAAESPGQRPKRKTEKRSSKVDLGREATTAQPASPSSDVQLAQPDGGSPSDVQLAGPGPVAEEPSGIEIVDTGFAGPHPGAGAEPSSDVGKPTAPPPAQPAAPATPAPQDHGEPFEAEEVLDAEPVEPAAAGPGEAGDAKRTQLAGRTGQPTRPAPKTPAPTMLAPEGHAEEVLEAVPQEGAQPPADVIAAETVDLAGPPAGASGHAPAEAPGKGAHEADMDVLAAEALGGHPSDVDLGAKPPKSERPSGVDRIAEAVESGVDLGKPRPAEPPPDTVHADEDAAAALLGAPDSAVDLGSRPSLEHPPEEAASAAAAGAAGAAGEAEAVGEAEPAGEAEAVAAEHEHEEEVGEPVGAGAPSGGRSMMPYLIGGGAGLLIALLIVGGLWFAKVIQFGTKEEKRPPAGTLAARPKTPLDTAHEAMDQGDYAQAVQALQGATTPEEIGLRAQARWRQYLESQRKANKAVRASDPAVKEVQADLAKANKPVLQEEVNNVLAYREIQGSLKGRKPNELLQDRATLEGVRDALKNNPAATQGNAGLTDLRKGVANVVSALEGANRAVGQVQAELKDAGYPARTAADVPGQVRKLAAGDRTMTELADQLKTNKAGVAQAVAGLVKDMDQFKTRLNRVRNRLRVALGRDRLQGKPLPAAVNELAADRDKAEKERDRLAKVVRGVRERLQKGKHLTGEGDEALMAGLDKAMQQAVSPLATAAGGLAETLAGAGGSVAGELNRLYDLAKWSAGREARLAYFTGREPLIQGPEAMLDHYLWQLQNRDRKDAAELAKQAARDARWVIRRDTQADAATRAKAEYVLGLALRNQEDYAEARRHLETALADAGKGGKADWKEDARKALKNLTDPLAFSQRYEKLKAEGKGAVILPDLTAAAKAAPKSDKGSLMALAALVHLEQALKGGKKLTARTPGVAEARREAREAIAAGAEAEGNYVLGRLAEETGDLPAAVRHYQVAARYSGRKELASLYRLALARILLNSKAGRGGDEEPAGDRNQGRGRADREGAVSRPRPPARPARVSQATSPHDARLARVALLLMLTTAMQPDDEGPGADRNPNVDQAIKLAQEAIDLGDPRGHLLLGEALTRKGEWTRGLEEYIKGLRQLYPGEETRGLQEIVSEHPALQMPESVKPPQPLLAEQHYTAGLDAFWARQYRRAENEFAQAVKFYGRDARYQYFLGLARLMQNTTKKKGEAYENFRLARRLEKEGLPDPADVNASLERIQGRPRRVLDGFRK